MYSEQLKFYIPVYSLVGTEVQDKHRGKQAINTDFI